MYRTFTLQSCVVIYGCRSLIRRIRTPLSPHVCCPSIDPIYPATRTGVREVRAITRSPVFRGVKAPKRVHRKRKLIQQRKRDGGICNSDFSDCFLLCLHVHVPCPSLSLSLPVCLFLLSSFSLFLPPLPRSLSGTLLLFLSRIYGESFIGPRELFIRNFRRASGEPRVKVARLAT